MGDLVADFLINESTEIVILLVLIFGRKKNGRMGSGGRRYN